VGPSHSIFSIHTTLDQSIITWYMNFQFFIQHHINVPTERHHVLVVKDYIQGFKPLNSL